MPTTFLDASVLVRYFVNTPPEMAERAQALIDNAEELVLTETTLLETTYVLESIYGQPRDHIVDTLVDFLQRRNISVRGLDSHYIVAGLMRCRSSRRVSFGDALLWAAARQDSPAVVYSFNRRFPSQHIDLREP